MKNMKQWIALVLALVLCLGTMAACAAAPAPAPTEEETVPDEARPEGSSGWIGLMIVGIVLTVLAVGGLIFRKSTRRGRYSGR